MSHDMININYHHTNISSMNAVLWQVIRRAHLDLACSAPSVEALLTCAGPLDVSVGSSSIRKPEVAGIVMAVLCQLESYP